MEYPVLVNALRAVMPHRPLSCHPEVSKDLQLFLRGLAAFGKISAEIVRYPSTNLRMTRLNRTSKRYRRCREAQSAILALRVRSLPRRAGTRVRISVAFDAAKIAAQRFHRKLLSVDFFARPDAAAPEHRNRRTPALNGVL